MVEQDFSQKNPDKKTGKDISPFDSLSQNVIGLGSRLRVLEERYVNARKKTQMTDENLLDFEKDIRKELKSLNQDILELKRSISEMHESLLLMSSELDGSVKQYELKVIEKYVDMWQPMDFVTMNDLKRYLKDNNKKI